MGVFFVYNLDFQDYLLYILSMETIKSILSQFGYITKSQLVELKKHFPHMVVVIKWGGMQRERIPVWQAAQRIQLIESKDIDYCREVFFCSKTTDQLREVFAIARP